MPVSTLSQGLVERVLEGLGLRERPDPDAAGLAALYAAWCEGVPFDNLQKRIHLAEGRPGPLPGDVPAGFFETWLAEGTGGTCWAGNGALASLLASLGFRATRGLCTMLPGSGSELPPNHATVVVALGSEQLLVDASILFGEPLPLRVGEATGVAHPSRGVRCEPDGDLWTVYWGNFLIERFPCRIDALAVDASEYTARHEGTRGWSPFNYQLSARIVRGDTMEGAWFGRRAHISATGEVSERAFEPGERLRWLVESLGIREATAARLPEDVEMPAAPKHPH